MREEAAESICGRNPSFCGGGRDWWGGVCDRWKDRCNRTWLVGRDTGMRRICALTAAVRVGLPLARLFSRRGVLLGHAKRPLNSALPGSVRSACLLSFYHLRDETADLFSRSNPRHAPQEVKHGGPQGRNPSTCPSTRITRYVPCGTMSRDLVHQDSSRGPGTPPGVREGDFPGGQRRWVQAPEGNMPYACVCISIYPLFR